MIRVVVVDDHTVMRQGLVGLLEGEDDLTVVGQAADAGAAHEVIDRTLPDLLLIDIGLPRVEGIEVVRSVKERHPDLTILMVTMHEREDYLLAALDAGASGYVLKGVDIRELLGAVRTVAAGGRYVPPSMIGALVDGYVHRSDRGDNLTDRERQVLRMVAEGLTTAEIAEALHLSPHTVQSHRDHIMTKLDLHSKVELTRYAISTGLVSLEP